MSNVRFIGLDVHAETIAVAVAEPDGEVRSLGVIPNRPESIRKLVKKLGPAEQLRVCYEAGPTGYVVYWQLTALGVTCEVVAPTLVPVKAGDRVKTDRRDALKLARSYRAGDLTPVWVPDAAHEALRFTKNRDRLLEGDIARAFFEDVVAQARGRRLLSAEHFTIDGTLLEAWAGRRVSNGKASPATRPTIPAIRRSISTGNGARIRRISRRPIPTAGCSRRPRATKPSWPISAKC